MAWNEPDNKDRDPWGSNNKQSPPDLEQLIRNLQNKIKSLFGTRPSGTGSQIPTSGKGKSIGFGLLAIVLLLIWALSGIFIVEPAEQGVILRFGKYLRTVDSGPHWIPRFIDDKYIVDVQKVSKFSYTALMLTRDENIVSVTVAVQYRMSDPRQFLFNVANPVSSLQHATASALRQVIGHTTLDDVLTVGREIVRGQVEAQINNILELYKTGITVTTVALQSAKAPEEVKGAFDDAIKAQEDEQRFINQAQAYARGVLPIAEGHARRIHQEAEAYKQQVIVEAQGKISRFLALLIQYEQSPVVMRNRMYINAVESVLSHTSKILLDINASNNLVYLPLDRLLGQAPTVDTKVTVNPSVTVPETTTPSSSSDSTYGASAPYERPGRESYRGREE